ncbi:MAG: hypothetical protein ISR44_08310 [Rhodospirillales bacterium]|nr:hypothetical protein [Rhodospirillales bacterium]
MSIRDIARNTLTGLILPAVFLCLTQAQASELVVFAAEGLSLQSGQVIDSDHILHLEAGQKITLISTDGTMFTVAGRYDGAAAANLKQDGEGVFAALKGLMSPRNKTTTALGVARTADFGKTADAAASPQPWLVDTTRAGAWCYRSADDIELWRPASQTFDEISLTSLDETWNTLSRWPDGTQTMRLPAGVPVKDNAKIWFTVDDKDTLITFREVPASVPSKNAMAAWMIGVDCIEQARMLVSNDPA